MTTSPVPTTPQDTLGGVYPPNDGPASPSAPQAAASRRFSTVDACEWVGVSYRQADYWIRLGLVGEVEWHRQGQAPGYGSGSGWKRTLTAEQLGCLCLVARVVRFTKCQPTAPTLRKLLDRWALNGFAPEGFLILPAHADEARYFQYPSDAVLAIAHSQASALLVDLWDLVPDEHWTPAGRA